MKFQSTTSIDAAKEFQHRVVILVRGAVWCQTCPYLNIRLSVICLGRQIGMQILVPVLAFGSLSSESRPHADMSTGQRLEAEVSADVPRNTIQPESVESTWTSETMTLVAESDSSQLLAKSRSITSGIQKVEQTAPLRDGPAAWAWDF